MLVGALGRFQMLWRALRPTATSTAGIRNVRFTSIRDVRCAQIAVVRGQPTIDASWHIQEIGIAEALTLSCS
jgi:hypothetical protein